MADLTNLPTVGADNGTWGDELNAALQELDAKKASAALVYTKDETDAKYIQTVNGVGPDENGDVVVEGGSGGTFSGVPDDGSVTDAKIAPGGLSPTKITGTAVINSDTRLTNARTPTAHAASHKTGGSDPLTAADVGALALSARNAANGVAPLGVDAKVPTAYLSAMVLPGNGTTMRIWVGSTEPTPEQGAADGDVWFETP